MAPRYSTLAWKIPWTEEPGRLQSMGLLRVGHVWVTSLLLSCIGEGNGNPLQCSCLENPRDGGAWWAAVYGVAQSRIQLKRRSSSSSHGKSAIWVPRAGLCPDSMCPPLPSSHQGHRPSQPEYPPILMTRLHSLCPLLWHNPHSTCHSPWFHWFALTEALRRTRVLTSPCFHFKDSLMFISSLALATLFFHVSTLSPWLFRPLLKVKNRVFAPCMILAHLAWGIFIPQ